MREEPVVDHDEVDDGLETDGEFVSGALGAVAFEPVDAAFDGMALLVDLGVERRWTPSCWDHINVG